MDPEMIRLAQEQMSRIPPEDLQRMQEQMFSNPDLLRMASEGMKNMRPEDLRFAAEQMRNLPPETIADMSSRMASVTPEQFSSMGSYSTAQENYEYQGALMLKNQGNQLHGSQKFGEAIEKYLKAKRNVALMTSLDAVKLRQACSANLMSCYLKTSQYDKAIEEGTEVLASDSDNLKALYRRGQAYKELGRLEEAVNDLTRAAEVAPDDETVADVLRQAKEELESLPSISRDDQPKEDEPSDDQPKEDEPSDDQPKEDEPSVYRDGPIIEEITEEEAERLTSSSKSEPREEPPQGNSATSLPAMPTPGDPTYTEAIRTMQSNPELIRNMQRMVSTMDPETVATLSGGRMTPEMAKMGADMMKNMSSTELERMMEMAGRMHGAPPTSSAPAASTTSSGFGMPQMNMDPEQIAALSGGQLTPEMARVATDMMKSMPPQDLERMVQTATSSVSSSASSSAGASSSSSFSGLGMPPVDPDQMASLSGGKLTPEMAKLGVDMMKNMAPEDLERMASLARNMQAGTSSATLPGASGLGMPANLQAQLKDPAMKEMMVSMMRNMTPESMASMSEQMGMKLTPDQAAEFQKSMSQLSPEQLDTMMRWAERAQIAAEKAKKAKQWILGRPGLIFAFLMLVVAMLLHYFGFIGR